MEFNSIEILGLIAAACTSFGWIPQIRKTLQSKSVDGLSLPMYMVICLGTILWLVYGILVNSTAVILANVVAISLTLYMVIMIVRYRK